MTRGVTPPVLYLNHAGTSWPKPEPVRDAVRAALDEPVEQWSASFAARHCAVARWLGVADERRLLLTPGCTAALAVGIGDHRWERGDRIVTSALEHHALHRPVLGLRGLGVEHVVVPPAGEAPLDLDALERVLRAGRVRLVALCAAANVTGALLPIEEAVRLAHAHGSLVLLDAAQIAGWLPIDVAALGVDMLATSVY